MRAAGPSGLAFVIKRPHDWPCAGTACAAAARRPRTLAATGPQALAADPAQPHSKKSGHQSCCRGRARRAARIAPTTTCRPPIGSLTLLPAD